MSSFAPWPDYDDTPPDDALTTCVRSGSVDKVRDYLQKSLMSGERPSAQWKHLRLALMAAERPMIQLLVTWGARPSQDDLADLRNQRPGQFEDSMKLLALCGLNLARPPREAFNAAAPAPIDPAAENKRLIAALPEEWLKVLKELRRSAPEAMIAGGALRDTYNGAKVKDVDIFMGSRMFAKNYILGAFKRAGVTVFEQKVSAGYGTVSRKVVKGHAGKQFNKGNDGAESWTIIAGKSRTEYNIVLLKGDYGSEIRGLGNDTSRKGAMHVMDKIIRQFDIGLCQIATNGEYICKTPEYDADVNEKKLTLTRPNHSSRDHLMRIAEKYPEHKLCPAAHKLLNPPKVQRKAKPKRNTSDYIVPSGYGYVPTRRRTGGFSGY
jgi:hypothetical protein